MSLFKKEYRHDETSQLVTWEATRQRVQSFLDRAQHFEGFTNAEDPSLALRLHGNERALLVVHGAQLIAPRRLPGHWTGGNTGITFHVAKGMTARVGATGGQPIQGAQEPEVVDTGVATFTDHRVVFTGTRHSQEWDFAKVLGYHHEDPDGWTAIPVSDRQTVSGVRYNADHADEIRFALALGLARFHHAQGTLISDLAMQAAELDRNRPGGPVMVGAPPSAGMPAATTGAPAGAGAVAGSPQTPAGSTPAGATPTGAEAASGAVPVAEAASGAVPVAEAAVPAVPGASVEPEVGASAKAASSLAPVSDSSQVPERVAAASGAANLPAAGWYPDPYRAARLRWWDGNTWTGYVSP
jgi:Protein of unknown function (DUF2510)